MEKSAIAAKTICSVFWNRTGSRTVELHPNVQSVYRDRYNRVFLRLYETLRDLNHAIGHGAERKSGD